MNSIKLQSGLALLLAGGALALAPGAKGQETQNLYKCVDAKGVVSIQAKPCPAGSKQAWVRPAQTEPRQTPAEIQAARERDQRTEQQVRDLSTEVNRKMAEQAEEERIRLQPAAPPAAKEPGPEALQAVAASQCKQAQEFMAAVREKTWLSMTDDQMKRVYNWVADQCRVNTASQ